MSPWGHIFSESLIFSPVAHFLQVFPLNDILTVSPNSNAQATYVDLAVK